MPTILNWYYARDMNLPQSGANIPNLTVASGNGWTEEVIQLDGGSVDNEFSLEADFSQYVSGNITIYPVGWCNATTGNMRFGGQVLSHAVNAGTSYLTHAFATATIATVAAIAVANDLIQGTLTLSSNLDSITSAKSTRIKMYRNASDTTNDNLAVVFNLFKVGIAYDI